MSAHTKFNILLSGGSGDGLLFCFSTEGLHLTALPVLTVLLLRSAFPSRPEWTGIGLKEDSREKKQEEEKRQKCTGNFIRKQKEISIFGP